MDSAAVFSRIITPFIAVCRLVWLLIPEDEEDRKSIKRQDDTDLTLAYLGRCLSPVSYVIAISQFRVLAYLNQDDLV